MSIRAHANTYLTRGMQCPQQPISIIYRGQQRLRTRAVNTSARAPDGTRAVRGDAQVHLTADEVSCMMVCIHLAFDE